MAVDRKQQMKEITERLEQGVKDIFTSEMYTTYLRTMAKFHNYSFNNTLLIAMQRPDATLVAGFNAEMAALVQQTIPKMQQLNEKKFKGLELEWHRPEDDAGK